MNIRNSFRNAYVNFIKDKKNIIFTVFGVFVPISYELFGFMGVEQNITPYTLPATITNSLQNLLGTGGIAAYLSSWYYFLVQLLILGGLVFIVFFSKKPWIYILAILICFVVDSTIYLFFPLAPPVRTEMSEPIRLNLFPVSDYIITAKYSAFPSGHIMTSFLAVLICRKENFKKTEIFYILNTFIMSFVVVYLGEHYLIDAFGGVLLALFGFKLACYMGKKYVNEEKKAVQSNSPV